MIRLNYQRELTEQPPIDSLLPFFTGDAKAHEITVYALENGGGADLTGCTAECKIVKPDGTSTTQACTVTDNAVSVILPASAYEMPGREALYIRLKNTTNASTATIWAATVLVD